ncbi:hypothetical protein IEQ34_008487 [Dendrobium chrysotoxum]|uniref:Uncharacterized protein n=1 Tax=Dendrobium chrysotoxum TaxID=161865 RepID=A0AAV7GY35_DENCH|nr:hypothetical protein IEQ34_008487 [Dendrobium chrysotoxum]
MAVRAAAAVWAACERSEEATGEAAAEAAAMAVSEWREIRRRPQGEGRRRRERVRKMQLEAAPMRR